MNDPHRHEIAGHLAVVPGNGGLVKLLVDTPWSSAEVYLHGAHVTGFRKTGEPPLLFVSGASAFDEAKPIRGGIPVVFPWFGPRDGSPSHGFARITEWHLTRASRTAAGAVTLHLTLPNPGNLEVEYRITVAESLMLELIVTNRGDAAAVFENCLHSYFQIAAIQAISIAGLTGATFLDQLQAAEAVDTAAEIRIDREVDRVYHDTVDDVQVIDPELKRIIRVRKSGSRSTVVWNPWIEKSRRMEDFGDDEYLRMVCVESGNIGKNAITLPAGDTTALRIELSSGPLA